MFHPHDPDDPDQPGTDQPPEQAAQHAARDRFQAGSGGPKASRDGSQDHDPRRLGGGVRIVFNLGIDGRVEPQGAHQAFQEVVRRRGVERFGCAGFHHRAASYATSGPRRVARGRSSRENILTVSQVAMWNVRQRTETTAGWPAATQRRRR